MRQKQQEPKPIVRCAVYTRKSTEHGLQQPFSSLDAQRSMAEAYITSQSSEGWVCLPDRYDDGGFTGGNTDRPAFRQLMADISAKKIDCIVVYKFDRLSRSIRDFLDMMNVFEHEGVSFASITEQFNTATPIGRLLLHMLLGLSQFEREQVAERTRDKIAATRRKGRWTGGTPILGYDVINTKLVVDEVEAERVRQIFSLYLELGSLLPVVEELNRRGWATKRWTTKKEVQRGGLPFMKNRLHQLLTNVTYIGKIRYKTEVHEGEHEAIVDAGVFQRVQQMLADNGKGRGGDKRNKHGALLRGLLKCASCNCGMTHTYTTKGQRRYRYYVCNKAQQNGWKTCPSASVPAGEIERFVVEEIKAIGRDPALVAATLAESRRLANESVQCLKRERSALERQRRADEAELRRLAAAPAKNGELDRLVEVQERIAKSDRRFAEVVDEIGRLAAQDINDAEVTVALAEFDGVWASLAPREQVRVIGLLVERVDYEGIAETIEISFRPTGFKVLADREAQPEETAA